MSTETICVHNDTVSMTVPGVRSEVEYCRRDPGADNQPATPC